MMKEHKFWALIERSINEKKSIDKEDQSRCMKDILRELSLPDIVGFQKRFLKLRKDLDCVWFQGYAYINNYSGVRAYKAFSNWIISLGKEQYKKHKEGHYDLSKLNNSKSLNNGTPLLISMDSVAHKAFMEKTGLEYIHWEQFLDPQDLYVSKRIRELDNKKNNSQDLER